MSRLRLVRIQGNGQVTLPAEVRRKHDFRKGDLVVVEDTGRGVLITPQATVSAAISPLAPEEIARRKTLVAQILANREQRDVRPLTAADLVHMARKDEGASYDPGE